MTQPHIEFLQNQSLSWQPKALLPGAWTRTLSLDDETCACMLLSRMDPGLHFEASRHGMVATQANLRQANGDMQHVPRVGEMTDATTHQGILHATLIAPDLHAACNAYLAQLGLEVCKRGELDVESAQLLGLDDLRGHAVAWLANEAGEPILRLIEDSQAVVREPMFHHGWLALEVLVGDVDALATGLQAPFRVLGPPADLELSAAIRACQVLGPCGELLYLTQIKAAVPPFDLPMSDARVSRPFIGVMSSPDRSLSQAAWTALAGQPGWAFDTKITVLNRAHGMPLEGQYPVAVVPLAGQCLVEIDQVELSSHDTAGRRAGLHSLAWRLPGTTDASMQHWNFVGAIDDVSSGERRVGLCGPAGEHVELLGRMDQDTEPATAC